MSIQITMVEGNHVERIPITSRMSSGRYQELPCEGSAEQNRDPMDKNWIRYTRTAEKLG